MKPKTKTEKEVAAISAKVTAHWERLVAAGSPQVRAVQVKAVPCVWGWLPWAKRRAKDPDAPTAYCYACGHELIVSYDTPDKELRCPYCGRKLKRARDVNSRCGHRWHDDFDYVIKAEAHGEWQLLRYFIVKSRTWAGEGIKYATPTEVVRRWSAPGKKTTIESIGMVGLGGGWREVPWNFNGDLTLKHEGKGGYYSGGTSYRIDTWLIAAGAKWAPWLTRDGFRGMSTCRALKCELYDAIEIFHKPHLLTLYKAGRMKLLSFFVGDHAKDIDAYWPSLKVALRHGYDLKDIPTWCDHIDLLKEAGLDVRSPRYICPFNLGYEHEQLTIHVDRIRRAKEAEQRRKDAVKYEQSYAAKKGPYFGLVFVDGNVVISTIQSVAEVADEGAAMHHCVYTNRYYEKDGSLLLSAKDAGSGERLETIEVSLNDFKVLQSRAKFNKESREHKHILRMMEDAMPAIRKAAQEAKKRGRRRATA